MTQALILAAGRGSRMLHLTETQPKCLVSLGGKTLLDWQIEALQAAGIHSIFLVTGYLAHKLHNKGFPCFFNGMWETSNMVRSLFCASEILSKEDTLISYSDIIYHPDIISKLLESSADIAISYDLQWKRLWEARFSNPLTDAETFRLCNNQVIEIGQKPKTIDEIEGQYMGLLKITKKGWTSMRSIETDEKMDMTTFLQKLIKSNIRVDGVPIQGRWCEIDSLSDLIYCESALIQKLKFDQPLKEKGKDDG